MLLRRRSRREQSEADSREAGERLSVAVPEWPERWLAAEEADAEQAVEVLARAPGPSTTAGTDASEAPVGGGARPTRSLAGRVRGLSRVDPGRGGLRAVCAIAVLAVAVTLLVVWLQRPATTPVPEDAGDREAGQVVASEGAGAPPGPGLPGSGAEPSEIVVAVVGRVTRPGLARLEEGARVADAIAAVGGALPDADLASVNLAEALEDGQQVVVLASGTGDTSGGPDAASGGGSRTSGPGSTSGLVDLNRAGVAELDGLPGVGPVLAERIVAWREEHGRFTAVDDLKRVAGIGAAKFDDLRDRVRV